MSQPSRITIVSGPPGAGKTSICVALCERFQRAVHLDTDKFHGAIRSGYILPWTPESKDQNEVIVTAAARAALPYVEAGYEVFIDGVALAWAVAVYRRELADVADRLHFVLLLPDADACMRRGAVRTDHAIVPLPVYTEMHAQFAATGYETHRLYSSTMSLEETVDTILRERDAGRYLLG